MKLVAHEVTKRFNDLVALDRVSVEFRSGEIHAVLGENGAGKSTLMSVLSGFLVPDAGTVTLDGAAVPCGRAFDCKRLGIEMIHQHFTLVPDFTVEENLALNRLDRLMRTVSPRECAQPALEFAKRVGWEIDPSVPVRTLSVGVQQRIEILKAVSNASKVLILDEPTAVLSGDEVEDLFRVLRALRDEGRIIILIAHKLKEVLSVADRMTVLRLGKKVGEVEASEADPVRLAEMMVGEVPVHAAAAHLSAGEVRLAANSVRVLGDRGEVAVPEATFQLRAGEIVGFGGVDGNGQVELAEALAGVRQVASGEVGVQGSVGYIPQDRQADGLALRASVVDNMLVSAPRIPELFAGPMLRMKHVRSWSTGLVRSFGIKASSIDQRVESLSGGNQQKVVVSRTLSASPDVLIVVNPTRGLDFKATAFVRDKLLQERERGAAIALFTTDLDELLELSDRTFFVSRGKLVEGSDASAYLGEGS